MQPILPCSVCPFYSSRADIVPSRYVNPTWAAYPPVPEKLGELYELVGGFDALLTDSAHVGVDRLCEPPACASMSTHIVAP